MNAKSLWIVLAIVCCGDASRCPKVCVLDDVPCVTRGANNVYKLVVEPVDPYRLESLEGIRGSTKYTLRNIESEGYRNCVIKELRFNVTSNEYEYYLQCPKLVSTFNYELEPTPGSPGQNKRFAVTACDYVIITSGEYGIFVSETDHQPHLFIKSALVRTYVEGKLIYDVEDLSDPGNKSQDVNKHDNQKETVECLLSIIVRKAIIALTAEGDTYTRTHLLGEVFPAYSQKPW